jgi:hypothetical protein
MKRKGGEKMRELAPQKTKNGKLMEASKIKSW